MFRRLLNQGRRKLRFSRYSDRLMRKEGLALYKLVLAFCGLTWLAFSTDLHAVDPEKRYEFHIAEETLGKALSQFVRLTKAQLILPHELSGQTGINPVIGKYTISEALDVLLNDTALSGGLTEGGVIVISLYKTNKHEEIPEADVNKTTKNSLLASIVAALFGADSSVAQSQNENASGRQAAELEEIVVTARRRAESLQDVPVAVTAISQEELLNNAASDLKKVAELAPQVIIGEFGSGTGAVLTVRGIGSEPIDFGLDQSVLVVMDGVPIGNASVIRQSLFDTRQVEVMPGPQALFFGKNATAGVISLKTADPTDTFEGYVKTGYEFEAEELYGEAVVSGPISETLSARLSLRASDMEGWIDNVAPSIEDPFHPGVILPGNVNDTSPESTHKAGRLSLQWAPSEDFDANLKFMVDEQKIDGNGNLAFHETWCTGAANAPLTLGVPQAGADCERNGRVSVGANPPQYAVNIPYANNGVPYRDNEFFFGSLTLNKIFGDVTLTSTTGYYDQDHDGSNCADGVYCQLFSTIATSYEQVTQEFRVDTDFSSPFNFMGGVYIENHKRYWFTAVDFLHLNFNPATQSYATWENEADGEYDGYSAFGQVRWDITPSVELALGARYGHHEKESTVVNLAVNPISPIPLYPEGQVLAADFDDDNVSPEMTLTWHLSPDQMLYAAYKNGYKAGGISNPSILFAADTVDTITFDAEEADGFEVGYKASLLDNTLRLNLVAYQYDIDDLQVVSFDINSFSFKIGNAAASRAEGAELSFLWHATDRLTFRGNYGYNRARYLDYPAGQCYAGQTAEQGCIGGQQDLSGKPTARAPDQTLNIGASYDTALVPGWRANLSIAGSYSDSYNGATNNIPGAEQSDFWRLNSAIHISSEDERYRLSLIGRNLTDEHYLATGSNLPFGGPNDFLGPVNRPREVILEAQYNFY